MSGFTKLFSSIVHSTVWQEPMHIKVVWVTMLALANQHGDVPVSVPGLAMAAGVTMDQCIEAVKRLSAPDEWSRTKAHEGRRIEAIDGGFRLLNHGKYREMRNGDERRIAVAAAVAKHRKLKKKSAVIHGNPPLSQAEAEANTNTEKRSDMAPAVPASPFVTCRNAFVEAWKSRYQEAYPFTSRDAKDLAELLEASPEVARNWQDTVSRYLDDPWHGKNGRHALHGLCRNVVRYSGPVKPSAPPKAEPSTVSLAATDRKVAELRAAQAAPAPTLAELRALRTGTNEGR